MQTRQASRSNSLVVYSTLTIFTLVGLLLRLYGAAASLWLDELHTAWVVCDGLFLIPERAALGNNHASYFYLPWVSTTLFGMHEWSLRLPSILAGTALVPLVHWVVMAWARSHTAALLAAGLVVIDPWSVVFSQESRVYALVQLVSLLQVYTLSKTICSARRSHRLLLVLLSLVLFYLHFTTALLLLAECVFWLSLRLRDSAKQAYGGGPFAVDAFLFVVGACPGLSLLTDVWSRRTQWELFVAVPTITDAVSLFPIEVYVLLPLFLAGVVAVCSKSTERVESGRPAGGNLWLLVGIWFVVPVTLAVILSWCDVARLFHARYLIAVAVAPAVMAGLLCANYRRRARPYCAALILVVAIVNLGPVGQWWRDGDVIHHRREDWRAALKWLREEARPQAKTSLLFRSGLIEADDRARLADESFVDYCLFPLKGIYGIDDLNLKVVLLPTTNTETALELQQSEVLQYGHALFLIRAPDAVADRWIRNVLERYGPEWTLQQKHFAGVTVAKLERFEGRSQDFK